MQGYSPVPRGTRQYTGREGVEMPNAEDRVDRALRLLVEVMALVERVEESIGELAAAANSGKPASPGSLYAAYTSIVRLHDKLAELRDAVYRLASPEE